MIHNNVDNSLHRIRYLIGWMREEFRTIDKSSAYQGQGTEVAIAEASRSLNQLSAQIYRAKDRRGIDRQHIRRKVRTAQDEARQMAKDGTHVTRNPPKLVVPPCM